MREPRARRFLTAIFISCTNVWVLRIAQDWLVLTLTSNNATILGVTTAAQLFPTLVLGLWGGALADRFSKVVLVFCSEIVNAAAALALGVLGLLGVIASWQVVLVALIGGIAAALSTSARQAAVVEMVDTRLQGTGISLVSTAFNLGRIIGPVIAGALISLVGTYEVFVVGSGLGVVTVLCLRVLRADSPGSARWSERDRRPVSAGVRYVLDRRDLLAMSVTLWFVCMFGWNSQLMLALLGRVVFGATAERYALLGTVFAVGSLVGSSVMAWRGGLSSRLLVVVGIAFSALQGVTVLMPSYALFMLMLVPLGATSLMVANATSIYFQISTEESLRGRVLAVYITITTGSVPVGALVIGWISSAWGPRATFLLGGILGVCAVIAGTGFVRFSSRRERVVAQVNVGHELPDGCRPVPDRCEC